jgi:GAF domain-containing protein
VIFYTAIYHEREAGRLAAECQVTCVLVKPCEPAVLLAAVKQALSGITPPADSEFTADFDRQHLTLITNKLAEKSNALEAANARLQALQDLNVLLSSDRDPHLLLERACAGARRLIGCRFAVLAVVDDSSDHIPFLVSSGIASGAVGLPSPGVGTGPLSGVVAHRHPWRAHTVDGSALECGLPPGFPSVKSVLAVPLLTRSRALGWMCLADKIGSASFDVEDERFLSGLGAMTGRLYEHCSWQSEQRGDLEMFQHQEERIRERLEDRDLQLRRLHAMTRGLLALAADAETRQTWYDGACGLLVAEGGMGLAVIDARESQTGELRTVAVAGDRAGVPPPQSREGSSQRGLVASVMDSRQALVCNELNDASEFLAFHQLLFRKGYRALAVLPLMVGDAAIGGLVVATRRPGAFDEAETRLLSAVVDAIALSFGRFDREAHAA